MMEAASSADKTAYGLGQLKQAAMNSSPSPDLSSAGSSPMSFDSDSHELGGYSRKMIQIGANRKNGPNTTTCNSNNNSSSLNNNNNNSDSLAYRPVKSPILIKYNYYDNSGTKLEQTNLDMNFGDSTNKIQRQLSPTFKQSLDQIVRNSQQQLVSGGALAGKHANRMSPDSSNESHQQQQQLAARQLAEYRQVQLARRYKMSSYEQRCLRCKKTVYQMDKLGPLKDFTFYHQNCFKCRECGTKLTLKTYFNNQQSSVDQEVYCHRHCPKTPAGKLDNHSVGIRAALNAPKVFEANAALACNNLLAADGSQMPALVGGQSAPMSPTLNPGEIGLSSPNVDSRALHIQHAVQQTRLQSIYKHSQVDKKISQFINRRLEFLEPKQKMLEMRHREEEDALFKAFELKWHQEESCISEQIRQEWQLELNKLLDKYRRQLSSISSSNQPAKQECNLEELARRAAKRPLQMQQQRQASPAENKSELSKQQAIEFERLNLEKTMTIKLDRKKETLKRKLKEFERQATAELVEKQSREMLALISMKLDEYKEEQKVGRALVWPSKQRAVAG